MAKIGNQKHEKILNQTIKQMIDDGYKMIQLDGKSPTAIAINDEESVAITINKDKNKTITYLEDWYDVFDRIERVVSNDKEESIKKLRKKYQDYSFVYLNNKSPDAIAYKNKCIFAVEIIGIRQGYNPDFHIKQKESIYDMFDGLMVKTFHYDNDSVFTQTFGRNNL